MYNSKLKISLEESKMVRIIKWQADWITDEIIKGKSIILFDRFEIAKGYWKGLMFDLQGLGFTKGDKLLNLKKRDKIILYFLKWVFTYYKNKDGYKDNFSLVTITENKKII